MMHISRKFGLRGIALVLLVSAAHAGYDVNDPNADHTRAGMLLLKAGNLKGAVFVLKKAMKYSPKDPKPLEYLAHVLEHKDHPEPLREEYGATAKRYRSAARSLYMAIPQCASNISALYDMETNHTGEGIRFAGGDDHCRAIAHFRAATLHKPEDAFTWRNLAIALDDVANPARVRDAFEYVMINNIAKRVQQALEQDEGQGRCMQDNSKKGESADGSSIWGKRETDAYLAS
eukprot:g486.t1